MVGRINDALRRFPLIRVIIKRIYQLIWYMLGSKEKAKGKFDILAEGEGDVFFGYYDSTPYNADCSMIIYTQAKDMHKHVCAKVPSDILIKNPGNASVEILDTTNTCNTQQGAMLKWLGPDFNREIIFNDCVDEKYISKILNIETKEKHIIDMPIYSVSDKGDYGYTLDFSRLHTLRPGYGYDNIEDKTKGVKCPDEYCLYKVDLKNNITEGLLRYTDLKNFKTVDSMEDAFHIINHIMISPDGSRIMFLHRWFDNKNKKHSRLITCDANCKDMYNLISDSMISHCNWLDNSKTIIVYANVRGVNGYFKLQDKTQHSERIMNELTADGHPSISPDGKYIVTDTYPDKTRKQYLYIYDTEKNKATQMAQVFAPFNYDNETRCDLHPKFSRDGRYICFDSTYEGKRKIYFTAIEELESQR